MDEDQQFCLRWNNHQSTLISVFDTLLEKGTLVDCTLAAEGQFLKAHKVVLSACSPYFAALLSQQYDKHPIFILKDVKFQELRAMMDYMYRGEVNISQDQLAALLKAAESLQIKGLSDSSGGRNNGSQSSHAKDTTAANKNASSKGSGLTIEQKMPRLAGGVTQASDADLSESHEGSASPSGRKRKKVRRRSVDTNNVDNHDHHSNSSSHSMQHGGATATQQQSQSQQQTASTMPTNITSATSSANVLSVTKKTDHELKSDVEMDENDDQQHRSAKEVQRQNNGGRKSISSATPTGKPATGSVTNKDGQRDLIEPKNEYDESNQGTVEDLTLDEEEMLEELEQAGPSHGGEGSSQGYPQWQGDRSQDNEAFMPGQDAAGHHRDAQAKAKTKPSRVIPSGGVSPLATSAISSTTTLLNPIDKMPSKVPAQFNNGVAKKTTKNHPRIKYSIKHPPVAGQPTSHSMASLVSSISAAPVAGGNPNQKSELLNFTLSRKFGKLTNSIFETEQTKVGTTFPTSHTIYMSEPALVVEEPVDAKTNITNEELQTSIISELSNYEIDDIELNPYNESASIEKESHSSTMFRVSADDKLDDSNEMKYMVSESDDAAKNFECRHCGKKYRWKSTLRRHENVECGGKEPAHQCPHCSYKAKQRGNLGVHIRKHHTDLPQLESRRKNRTL